MNSYQNYFVYYYECNLILVILELVGDDVIVHEKLVFVVGTMKRSTLCSRPCMSTRKLTRKQCIWKNLVTELLHYILLFIFLYNLTLARDHKTCVVRKHQCHGNCHEVVGNAFSLIEFNWNLKMLRGQ